MDPLLAQQMDEMEEAEGEEDDNDADDDGTDEYGAAIPEDPSILHVEGEPYDLTDPDDVTDAIEHLRKRRQELRDGELKEYEGRSTDWGGGGRSRLLYDQLRAELAQEYHEGRHQMSWKEQHQEAMKVVRIVAIRRLRG